MPSAAPNSPALLTRQQVAERLNVSIDTVKRLGDELCPLHLRGLVVRYDPDVVDAWLARKAAENTRGPAP